MKHYTKGDHSFTPNNYLFSLFLRFNGFAAVSVVIGVVRAIAVVKFVSDAVKEVYLV